MLEVDWLGFATRQWVVGLGTSRVQILSLGISKLGRGRRGRSDFLASVV